MSEARSFKLSSSFLEEYRGKQPAWGPVGYITFKRTYSRRKEDGTSEEFWETCKRVVEGCYNVQKKHCYRLGLVWDNVKSQRSAQEMFQRMWDFKWLPPGRGLWMMGTDYIDRVGGAALNNPLHEDTPILTKEFGWVPIKQLAGQEVTLLSSTKLYARDHSSFSASPTWVKGLVSDFDQQSCLKITTRDKAGIETEIIASVNHRWFRKQTTKHDWERVCTEELRAGDYLPIVRPAKNFPVSMFGAQHGLFFGDGTRSNGELHQFGDSAEVLRRLFTDVEKVENRRDDEYVVRNCPRHWADVPALSLDDSYLYGFLAGYVAADGSVKKDGQVVLSSSRREELLEVKKIFKLLGIRTGNITVSSTSSNYKEERELYSICIHKYDLSEDFFLKETHKQRWLEATKEKPKRDWAKVVSVEPAGYNRVLCAVVPEKEQFVVDNFILTSNCGFVSTEGIAVDLADPFCWMMDMLMLGVGVGFDAKGAGLVKISQPKQGDDVFVVEDSREGWVSLLRRIITPYGGRGSLPERIDYSLVRPSGSTINGFGGTASGPGPLDDLVKSVQEILNGLVGKEITTSAIVDLCNLVGRCVVAGNVRRSAEIAFGNPQDEEFLNLKNPDINKEALMSHRWASNNSIFATVGMDYTKVAEMTAKNGEPGYEWLENAQAFGRMGRKPDYRDRRARGGNPCLEQTLEDRELCCLVETFPGRHESYEDYEQTLKYAYLYAKSVTLIPTHDQRTNQVLLRNRRIGASMSGIVQAMQRHGRRAFLNWCDKGYNYLRELDKVYADWLCVRESIKITSTKPSGTVSLLPGVTPGIHYPHSEYYIRRIRFQANHNLVDRLKAHGYFVEPDKYSPNTVVAEFPVKEEFFDRSKRDVSMWEQLEIAAQVQQYWADNQVSVTITFKKEEAGDIKHALELYETRLKGVSFLPLDDHGYEQAPYEQITKEDYEEKIKGITPIIYDEIEHDQTERFCSNDTCEVVIQEK